MAKVTVLGRIKAKAGKEDQLKKELLALVPQIRGAAGNLGHELHQGAHDRSLFMAYQNWASEEEELAHRELPFMREYLSRAGELLDGMPDITRWELLEPSEGGKTVVSALERIARAVNGNREVLDRISQSIGGQP